MNCVDCGFWCGRCLKGAKNKIASSFACDFFSEKLPASLYNAYRNYRDAVVSEFIAKLNRKIGREETAL